MALTAAIALITGGVGWAVGSQVRSPADAAAAHRPPPASLITVPVVQRVLTATVNTQGTVTYGTPQPITLTGSVAAGDGETTATPLITKAPTGNRTLREGDVLLEVSGRPVFVFKGTVPMYRTLTRGSYGDDVRQLRAALRRLLPRRNVAATGQLDNRTIGAVKAWYADRGYQAAEPTSGQRAQLQQLQQAVAAAGPAGGPALADARRALADFRKTYGVSIASGEIVFLPRLPARLTTVSVKAGAPASGVIGTVADPTLIVSGTVSTDDAGLLKVGMAATMEHPTGDRFAATVTALGAAAAAPTAEVPRAADGGAAGTDDAGPAAVTGTPIRLRPRDPAELTAFAGQAFKVTIKVGSTGHAVLSVPVAAVFTASDGRARVTLQDQAGGVYDVPIEAGLSTGGFVQITPSKPSTIPVGGRVVVGTR